MAFCNGESKEWIAGWQDHGINAEDDAGEHAEKIGAGSKEGVQLILAAQFECDAGETRDSEERKNIAERPGFEVGGHLRLHGEGDGSDDRGEGEHAPPGDARDLSGAFAERAGGFELHPQSTMHHQGKQGDDADEDGVPIEDSGLIAKTEIRPERLKEVAAGIERHTANDIAERRAEKDAEEQARQGEDEIPQGNPDHMLLM